MQTSKQESKMIKDTREKLEVRKKNIAENFQVSHEGTMELEFKPVKYMGLKERLQMTKMKICVCADLYIK